MRIPEYVSGRSCNLSSASSEQGWLAKYVPAYDATILRKQERFGSDPLVLAAETAHRLFWVGTNIGGMLFSLELIATLLLDIYLHHDHKSMPTSHFEEHRQWVRDIVAQINRLFSTREITDECHSAFSSYCVLTLAHENRDIQRLERGLRTEYRPEIWQSYVRMKMLLRRYSVDDIPLVASHLVLLACDAGKITENPKQMFSCDDRFAILLKAAEHGISEGIPITELREYWREAGRKAGYTFGPLSHNRLFTSLPFTEEEFHNMLTQCSSNELRQEYKWVTEAHLRDMLAVSDEVGGQWGLDEARKTVEAKRRQLANSSVYPRVLVYPTGRNWRFVFRPRSDDPKESVKYWATYTYTTILRDAIFTNFRKSPWKHIDGEYRPVFYNKSSDDIGYQWVKMLVRPELIDELIKDWEREHPIKQSRRRTDGPPIVENFSEFL